MHRRVIGGVFVLGAVLLGLFAAVTFFFKAASWQGLYTFYALVGIAAEGIGAVACVIAARKYLAPAPMGHDQSAPAEVAP